MQYLALYNNYFDIDNPKKEGFTSIHCPFHEDKDKSAGIDLTSGVFSCRACNIQYSATKFLSRLTNTPMTEIGVIVDTYKAEKKLTNTENNFSKKYIFVLEKQDWRDLYLASKRTDLTKTFAKDFCEERGIDLSILKSCDVGFLSEEQLPKDKQHLGDCLTFPYFYGGKLVGLRFRNANGDKSGLDGSTAIPWGIDQLANGEKFVIVTEGESDRLKLIHELTKRGLNFPVISLPGSFFKAEWERDFSLIETFYLIPDTDNAGQELIKNFTNQYQHRVHVHKLNWAPFMLGKDLSEFINQNDCTPLIENIIKVANKAKKTGVVLSTSEFLATKDDSANEVLISNCLYQGQCGVLGGPQKSKKTFVLLNLVHCLLTPGSNFLGIPNWKSTDKSPKILFLEKEGARSKFQERVDRIVAPSDHPDNVYWWFKPNVKLDNPEDVKRIKDKIDKLGIGVFPIDPFQKMHSKNEDSATEMGFVWEGIFSIMEDFPELSIILIHHFGKDKSINDRWDALRGSSRMGGEVDFGWFFERKKAKSGQDGIRSIFEFRDEETQRTPDGKDTFNFIFDDDTGLISLDFDSILPSRQEDLEEEVTRRGNWLFNDALTHYNVTAPTLREWIKNSEKITASKPSKGAPVMLSVKGSGR